MLNNVLAKCANPVCGAKFQYLHAGRLFAIERRPRREESRSSEAPEFGETGAKLRLFWLCSTCSRSLTIQSGTAGGVRIAPVPAAREMCGCPDEAAFAKSSNLISNSVAVEERNMPDTKRKIELLRQELQFLDSGGYRLPLGWRAPLIFEDSPICPKPPTSRCPDSRCVLVDFIPREHQKQTAACRHIALNQEGETLDTLYRTATMEEIEFLIREWLVRQIAELTKLGEAGVPGDDGMNKSDTIPLAS